MGKRVGKAHFRMRSHWIAAPKSWTPQFEQPIWELSTNKQLQKSFPRWTVDDTSRGIIPKRNLHLLEDAKHTDMLAHRTNVDLFKSSYCPNYEGFWTSKDHGRRISLGIQVHGSSYVLSTDLWPPNFGQWTDALTLIISGEATSLSFMVRSHDKQIDGLLTRGVRYEMIPRDSGSAIAREQHAEQ